LPGESDFHTVSWCLLARRRTPVSPLSFPFAPLCFVEWTFSPALLPHHKIRHINPPFVTSVYLPNLVRLKAELSFLFSRLRPPVLNDVSGPFVRILLPSFLLLLMHLSSTPPLMPDLTVLVLEPNCTDPLFPIVVVSRPNQPFVFLFLLLPWVQTFCERSSNPSFSKSS